MNAVLKTCFSKAARNGLWAVGCYLWPFSRTPKEMLKRLFCGLAAGAALHPMIGRALFPSAEDVLASRGLDPAAVQRLTDQSVRVAKPGWVHNLYVATTIPSIPWMALYYYLYERNQRNSGFGIGSVCSVYKQSPLNPLRYTPLDLGLIVIGGELPSPRKFMASALGVREEDIEHMTLSPEEMFAILTFHELRHTDSSQSCFPLLSNEADADVHAMKEMYRHTGRTDIISEYLYFRLPSYSFIEPEKKVHNVALHLDAFLRGVQAPSPEQTIEAVKQAESVYDNIRADELLPADTIYPVVKAKNFRYQLRHHPEKFTDLSRRYVGLFVDATEYFMPAAMGVEPDAQHKSAAPRQLKPHA